MLVQIEYMMYDDIDKKINKIFQTRAQYITDVYIFFLKM